MRLAAVFLFSFVTELRATTCDTNNIIVSDGNLGQTKVFPWLGIVRVHLHEHGKLKVAVTGLVLVKGKFAIANANEMARIPRFILKHDSRVMFILEQSEPWFCQVKDIVYHPEFETWTMHTIALVELTSERGPFEAHPICLPQSNVIPDKELYAIGYTDEHRALEKFINKVQYIDNTVCNEFYSRAKLMENMQTPINYRCAFVINATEKCMWESGMVFATNVSESWTIVGLSIQGPGCAAPSRFLDVIFYANWINTVTTLDDVNDFPDEIKMDTRKADFADSIKQETGIINKMNLTKI